MKFTKMQGCGNDYVYVNGFTEKLSPQEKPEIVRKLSDRHFGIGGDGVIFINPAEEADFEMEMYNADGSRSEMCGNGIRCVAKYVYDKGLTDREDITIVSAGKIKYLKLTVEGKTATDRGHVTMVQVNMGQPVLAPMEVPVIAEATQQTSVGPAVVDAPITVDGEEYRMTCVSMGNPYDLALSGEGFFAIEFTNKAGETDTKYTRAGQFTLNKDGYLVTEEGDYVLDTQNRRIRLNTLIDSSITDDGTIYQNGQAVAKIQVTDFEDYDYLEKYGETYYQPIQGAKTIAAKAQVKSGYLEMANVQIVSEMVNLISITRAYESNQKVVQTIDDTLDVAVNQIGRVQ